MGPAMLSHESVLDELAGLGVPTTIIVGSLDAGFVAPSEQMHAAIDGSVLAVIEGAYHSPQHTHRDEWLAIVRDHLARI